MSAKHGVRSALRAVPALLAGGLLTACASVQVDVDVYKGPFAHEQEIQVKQYASLAASAKPVLKDLHQRVWTKNLKKEKARRQAIAPPIPPPSPDPVVSGVPIPVQNAFQTSNYAPAAVVYTESTRKSRCYDLELEFDEKFLCEVLDLYEEEELSAEDQSRKPSRNHQSGDEAGLKHGLDRLTQNVTTAFRIANNREKQDMAIAQLNEALIFFAQKVLFTVNNQQLFDDLDEAEQDTVNTQTAVLQSLGNTILVHANDLERRKVHTRLHKDSTGAERKAVASAFRPAPSAAFDAILKQLQNHPIPALGAVEVPDSPPTTPSQDPDLDAKKKAVDTLRSEADLFRASLPSLIAAHRTIVGETGAPSSNQVVTEVERLSAEQDRGAIAKLYPATALTDGDRVSNGALQPLLDWLERESGKGVVASPARPQRLANVATYLRDESARLVGAGIAEVENRDDVLKLVVANIRQRAALAIQNMNEQTRLIKTQEALVKTASGKAAKSATAAAAKSAHLKADAKLQSERQAIIAVVESVRREVVEQGEGAREKSGVRSLLKVKLAALSPAATGKPSGTDIALARAAVDSLPPDPLAPCEATPDDKGCMADTSLKVIDNLIASLRAQRIRALAAGDTKTAGHLMSAIEAAYSQRTSMIYLRPASDYLRSVYSSSAFQDGTDKQYRNMLTDTIKNYMNPFEQDKKDVKVELEKLYWQNVNKVTVNGGGQTNYVLAKDDVGNWYVKAYSSDPEMIIKSATSLAMFSAGKGMNVNLLRRMDLQRQLDDNKNLSARQRSELRAELAESNRQDGAPLLKVRDRYATRYANDTAQHVGALHDTLAAMPEKVKSAATAAVGDLAGCDTGKLTEGLQALATAHLEPARTRLAKLAPLDPAKPATDQTTESEKAIQASLTAIHLYAGQVHRAVGEAQAGDCGTRQRDAADSARKYARAQLVAMASERKLSIERYEDALASIADIAGEK